MLGQILKDLREAKGLRQQDLAEYLGVARGTYGHYEINRREPDLKTLKKLANFYNVSMDYFLDTNSISVTSEDVTLLREIKSLSPEERKALEIFFNLRKEATRYSNTSK